MDRREFTASLVAGGCAGMCVDLTLFPLDTIKTRLQSQRGFSKAGGFRGIYVGVPSAAVGSFPNGGLSDPRAHRGGKAACAGIALLQYPAGAAGNPAGRGPKGSVQGLPEHRAQGDSLLLGAVSFMGIFEEPLVTGTRSHPALLAGCCVWSVRRCAQKAEEMLPGIYIYKVCIPEEFHTGGVAAFVTTPLDVAKTRIMLAKAGSSAARGNVPLVLLDVWKTKGLFGVFAGAVPRVAFIGIGGFIFLGAYEKVRSVLL
ncbi:mitochondrial S-adenosylmethionine carrier protein isoform X2 [Scleropages formosus]|uniref:mitochondrial S-adenosylmethionine carrier protein isoform X2 n=1 Tax=Scleropages formosus TaxID=113540 RepID=UPI0010FACA47|nr:S-adenosylmethionine mitochondrial carrier protein isoform X2 [Scleropages formosus]